MAVIYVGTCPYDPELELKNFKQKQAEYEAAWRRTGDQEMLHLALLHADSAGQVLQAHLTPRWLVEALGNILMSGRAGQTAKQSRKADQMAIRTDSERLAYRMRHVQRYRCVRNYLRQGESRKNALNLAVVALEAAGEAASRWTIRDSYDLVHGDLERKGRESEFFLLVARADPTVVPVHVVRLPDGTIVINGVTVKRSDRQPSGQEGEAAAEQRGAKVDLAI